MGLTKVRGRGGTILIHYLAKVGGCGGGDGTIQNSTVGNGIWGNCRP